MIKLKSLWMGVCMVVLLLSCRTEKEVYLSTSFHEPATEGLRFIYSEDGIHWDSIAGVWLKPEVGSKRSCAILLLYVRATVLSIWYGLRVGREISVSDMHIQKT